LNVFNHLWLGATIVDPVLIKNPVDWVTIYCCIVYYGLLSCWDYC